MAKGDAARARANDFDYERAFVRMMEWYYNASDAAREAGKVWYPAAQSFALKLAARSRYTVEQTAGTISALSPRNQWVHNVAQANDLVDTGTCSGLGMNRNKGIAILALSDVTDAAIESILNGPKTIAFYRNIFNPFVSRDVTLDGWMATAGDFDAKHLANPFVYARLESLLQSAADDLGIMPHALQAIIWCSVRSQWSTMNKTKVSRKGN